ncbi:MAG: TetR/AcrR family transcriptional regulator [Neomegalonema sp.]|nr:TetR/AcrR family transcriptional regulator [Neomegalonema sp.]
MQTMWRDGYEACSVKAMSEMLGITRSSFYNAFGNREALFGEAFERYCARSPMRQLEQLGPDTPVLPIVTASFKQICGSLANDPLARGCLGTNCTAELVGVNEDLGPVVEQYMAQMVARLERVLTLAAQRGEIDRGEDPDRLRELARALQTLVFGLSLQSKLVRDEEALWQSARLTLEGLGLYADPAPASVMPA